MKLGRGSIVLVWVATTLSMFPLASGPALGSKGKLLMQHKTTVHAGEVGGRIILHKKTLPSGAHIKWKATTNSEDRLTSLTRTMLPAPSKGGSGDGKKGNPKASETRKMPLDGTAAAVFAKIMGVRAGKAPPVARPGVAKMTRMSPETREQAAKAVKSFNHVREIKGLYRKGTPEDASPELGSGFAIRSHDATILLQPIRNQRGGYDGVKVTLVDAYMASGAPIPVEKVLGSTTIREPAAGAYVARNRHLTKKEANQHSFGMFVRGIVSRLKKQVDDPVEDDRPVMSQEDHAVAPGDAASALAKEFKNLATIPKVLVVGDPAGHAVEMSAGGLSGNGISVTVRLASDGPSATPNKLAQLVHETLDGMVTEVRSHPRLGSRATVRVEIPTAGVENEEIVRAISNRLRGGELAFHFERNASKAETKSGPPVLVLERHIHANN